MFGGSSANFRLMRKWVVLMGTESDAVISVCVTVRHSLLSLFSLLAAKEKESNRYPV